jgi:alpha-glucosidase
LPLAPDHRHENVANQSGDPSSMLNLYRRLIAARRKHHALSLGGYRPVVAGGDLLLYVREHEGDRILLALNLGDQPAAVSFPSDLRGIVIISVEGDRDGERIEGEIDLRGDEGLAILLAPDAVVPEAV